MTFDIFQNFLTMPDETADISRFSHSPEKEKPPHIMSLLERHPPRHHHQFQKQRSMTAMYGAYGNYYGGMGYNGMPHDPYGIPPAYRKISAESREFAFRPSTDVKRQYISMSSMVVVSRNWFVSYSTLE
ncbi:hypothetical protein QR680_001002 [Steinernema hermaphroditum]|uniref:Uncharacterized protein n=1 Tax=Steinernema hermaphroditum TaxID=289476 RepID=A0AA39LF33_9BILA|nr:hypothetical protein QR680_001002 [Steinernema hermaphroditum]